MLGLLNLGFSGHIGISTRYEVRNIKRGVSVFLCALCVLRGLKTADNLQPGLCPELTDYLMTLVNKGDKNQTEHEEI